MGLTEREKQLLEELERSLTQGENPPKQARLPLSSTERGPRRLLAGLLISVLGLAALVTAAILRLPVLGWAGFVIMGLGLGVASSRRPIGE